MGKLIKRFQTTAQRLAYETSSDYRRPYLANCATETAQYGGKSNVTHYNQRYIEFEDPEVERICVTTWGDGEKISYTQASVVTNFGTAFSENTDITSFEEIKYFTGVTYLYGKASTPVTGAFFNCSGLTHLTIPPSITTLQQYSVHSTSAETSGLQSVTFNNTAGLTVNAYNFYHHSITRVDSPSMEQWLVITWNSSQGYINSNHSLYIAGEKITDVEIPELYISGNPRTSINPFAFIKCIDITSVTFPDTITTIGANAFNGCTHLTTFNFPESLTTIGANAFYNCTSLVGDITIPNTVTSIGSASFAGCNAVSSLTFPIGGVASIFEFCCRNGTLTINGNVSGQAYHYINGRDVIINGNTTNGQTLAIFDVAYVESLRINGNVTNTSGNHLRNFSGTTKFKFLEVMGTITITAGSMFNTGSNKTNGTIFHLGYNGVACTTISSLGADDARVSKIYVGSGESQAADQAVLDLYLADENWANYASKLDLWYNYNGEYKE